MPKFKFEVEFDCTIRDTYEIEAPDEDTAREMLENTDPVSTEQLDIRDDETYLVAIDNVTIHTLPKEWRRVSEF